MAHTLGLLPLLHIAALRLHRPSITASLHSPLCAACARSEIILRPYQLCNLTEVVVRASDDLPELRRKARLAAIMGTFQATLTDFSYVRDVWRNNTEAERLLGVSMTGIMDNTLTSGQQVGRADQAGSIQREGDGQTVQVQHACDR